jgi:hypothetical protein
VGLFGTAATTDLLYQPQMIGDGDCGEIGGMKIGRGNRSTRKKTCPNAPLSTTNPTCLDPGLNPGRSGGKPATNRLSYVAAFFKWYTLKCVILSLVPCLSFLKPLFRKWIQYPSSGEQHERPFSTLTSKSWFENRQEKTEIEHSSETKWFYKLRLWTVFKILLWSNVSHLHQEAGNLVFWKIVSFPLLYYKIC